jgi:hypothetical protein
MYEHFLMLHHTSWNSLSVTLQITGLQNYLCPNPLQQHSLKHTSSTEPLNYILRKRSQQSSVGTEIWIVVTCHHKHSNTPDTCAMHVTDSLSSLCSSYTSHEFTDPEKLTSIYYSTLVTESKISSSTSLPDLWFQWSKQCLRNVTIHQPSDDCYIQTTELLTKSLLEPHKYHRPTSKITNNWHTLFIWHVAFSFVSVRAANTNWQRYTPARDVHQETGKTHLYNIYIYEHSFLKIVSCTLHIRQLQKLAHTLLKSGSCNTMCTLPNVCKIRSGT